MHPLLARYLNLDAALDTLQRQGRGQVLKAEERTYADIASYFPEERDEILKARPGTHASEELQAALVVLASRASVAALREDPSLGAAMTDAHVALVNEGASETEASGFLAALVLEEAFGDDGAAESFDRDYFAETLTSVPRLASLTPERVGALAGAFVQNTELPDRPTSERAATAVLEAAWNEGPEPINVEHIDLALEMLEDEQLPADLQRSAQAVVRFLEFLERAKLMGPMRLAKLSSRALRAETPTSSLN
jgi:hypothetical protein